MEFIMNQKILEQLKKQGLGAIDADNIAKIMLEKGALDKETANQPESAALGSLLRAAEQMLTEAEVNAKLFTANPKVTAAMNTLPKDEEDVCAFVAVMNDFMELYSKLCSVQRAIRAAAVMDSQGKEAFFEQLDALYTRQDDLMCLLLPIYALLDTKEKMLFDEEEEQ